MSVPRCWFRQDCKYRRGTGTQPQPQPHVTDRYFTRAILTPTQPQPQPQPQTLTQPQTRIGWAAGEGVLEADGTIDKIETIKGGRRPLAESIGVRTMIKASNQGAAEMMRFLSLGCPRLRFWKSQPEQ